MESSSLLWASAILGIVLNFLTLVTMIGGAFWWAAKFQTIVEDIKDDVKESKEKIAENNIRLHSRCDGQDVLIHQNSVSIGRVEANCNATHRGRQALNATG